MERYYPAGLSFPVTAFLRIVPHQDGSPTHHVALLEFYDPLNATDLMIAGHHVPLETDLSTALAYALNQPELRDLDQPTAGLIHPDQTEKAAGLYMLEPYQPGKIPVLMVHGVWSSPITWMEMFNDLRSSPEIRDRFQFWFYLYPTGQPFWYSAAQLRGDLEQMRQTIDPNHREPALDQMVLVGHSMGGLVSRLQTVESGQDYWSVVSREPLDNVKASPEVKQTLAQAFYFHPNPSIRRVIMIATPNHGSSFVSDTVRWLSNRLITLPAMLVNGSRELHQNNPAFFPQHNLIDVTTSIDSLSPACPIFPVMIKSPHQQGVHYHSIVGLIPDKFLARVTQGDGVVSTESAHLEGVDSEIVVNAEHSVVHRHPLSVLEVRRILLEHAAQVHLPPPSGLEHPPITATLPPEYRTLGSPDSPPLAAGDEENIVPLPPVPILRQSREERLK